MKQTKKKYSDTIIDTSTHIWDYDPYKHTWLTDNYYRIKRNFPIADLESSLVLCNVNKAILSQKTNHLDETISLCEVVKSSKKILGLVAQCNINSSKFQKRFEAVKNNQEILAFKYIADHMYYLSEEIGNKLLLDNIYCLTGKGYSIEIDMLPKQIHEILEFISMCPSDINLIINNMGNPDIFGGAEYDLWETLIKNISQIPNIYLKISGTNDTVSSIWAEHTVYKYLDTIFSFCFPTRLIFGSNWPVCLMNSNYPETISLIKKYAFTNIKDKKNTENLLHKNVFHCYPRLSK